MSLRETGITDTEKKFWDSRKREQATYSIWAYNSDRLAKLMDGVRKHVYMQPHESVFIRRK